MPGETALREPAKSETARRGPLEAPALSALLRLHLTYLWRHGRPLSLRDPRRFTELVQRRKLVDRDPRIPLWTDKLVAKELVSELLGAEWVTPTLWSGETLPDDMPCAPPFVVKSRHGCRQIRIVRGDNDDWRDVRRLAPSWSRRSYGGWLDEWGYEGVPRGVLIEPFIGLGAVLPVDYKFYVFHGRVEAIQVHIDRATRHRWAVYDRSWQRLSSGAGQPAIVPPETLALMIEGAETLGGGFDFVRVDLYDIDTAPRFGEMTFYPGSGLDRFDPPTLDITLGRYWRSLEPQRWLGASEQRG